jgi:hypothetical protein
MTFTFISSTQTFSSALCSEPPCSSLAVPWLRQLVADLSLRRLGSAHAEFVVDKVALGRGFLRVLRFSPVSIIPPSFPMLIYHLGDELYVR